MNSLIPTLWAALGCPLCKTTIEAEGARVASGYNASVVVMLASLLGLAALLVFLFVRAARASDRAHALSGAAGGQPDVSAESSRSPREPSAAPPARSR